MAGVSIALGVLVGLILGLTGGGGTVFAVPLLMFGMNWSLPEAAPVALLGVSAAAAVGTIIAWDAHYIRYRAALLMAAAGQLGAPLGLHVADGLSPHALSVLLAAVLVLSACRTLYKHRAPAASVPRDVEAMPGLHLPLDPRTGRLIWTVRSATVIATIGAASGFLSGLLGIGGGLFIVPALCAVSALTIHSAVATSLMVVALTSAGTVLAHLARDSALPWHIALPFLLATSSGMLLGRKLAPRIGGVTLQKVFALAMLLIAVLVVLR